MENGNLNNLLHYLSLGFQTTEDWSTDTWEGNNVSEATENIKAKGTARGMEVQDYIWCCKSTVVAFRGASTGM
jgi:hypothetical protein